MPDRSSDPDLLELVGDIYDCAIEPTKWPAALERVGALLDGTSIAITLNHVGHPGFVMRAQWNIDPGLEAAMLANYHLNPLIPSIWYYGVDEPFSLLSFLDEEELKRTQFYKNTLGAYGICDSAVSLLAKSVGQFGSISIQRLDSLPPFGEEEFSLMRRLVPHIRRAAFIGELLESRTLEREMLSATLEALTVGIVLTDASGSIIHANRAASRMIEQASALFSDGVVISARNPQSSRDLAQAIALASSGTTVDIPRSGLVVSLRGSDGHDLAAWVLPLDSGLRRDLGAEFTARVAIFIRELGDTAPVPAELFVRRYGITPAECRVLMQLVQGQPPQEISETLGISLATTRTHIARLLEKTGTDRQVDLVRFAMTALAPATM